MNDKRPHEDGGACGAKTRAGTLCRRAPMPNGRCSKHGGKTPRGVASPNFKHGLYSKSMPERLAERFGAALADSELLELRREAALLTALAEDALQRIGTGETGELWRRLRKLWARLERATEAERPHALAAIGEAIESGATDAAAMGDVRAILRDRMRVVESERRRLVEANQMVSVERFMAFVGALSAAVSSEVPDRASRERILSRFEALLGDAHGGGH
jgi:hypothetical protein